MSTRTTARPNANGRLAFHLLLGLASSFGAGGAACDESEDNPGITQEKAQEQQAQGGPSTPSKGSAKPSEPPGPVVTDAAFELRASAEGPYKAGEPAGFGITLSGRSGWHVNEDFPLRVELRAPSGVMLAKPALEKKDAAEFGEARARFEVPFTPASEGSHRVEATVSFAMCTDENCIPEERTLAVLLPVEGG